MATVRPNSKRLDLQEREAGREYLDEVRAVEPARYPEVEVWAWSRLRQRLAAIAKLRSESRRETGVRS